MTVMTATKWDKSVLKVKLTKADKTSRTLSFVNVGEHTTPEQLHSFGELIATLTGEKLFQISEVTTSHVA